MTVSAHTHRQLNPLYDRGSESPSPMIYKGVKRELVRLMSDWSDADLPIRAPEIMAVPGCSFM